MLESMMKMEDGISDRTIFSKLAVKSKSPLQPRTAGPKVWSFEQVDRFVMAASPVSARMSSCGLVERR